MHAVIRTYSGAGVKKLSDFLEGRKKDVADVIGAVPGVVSYALIRTGDGMVSVTVCRDKAGADQSIRAAGDWIKQNAADLGVGAPAVSEGSVIVQLP